MGVDTVLSGWRDRVDELDGKDEEIREKQDGHYQGSWEAAYERAEPEIQKKAVERCIEDIEDSTTTDELLEAMADWRQEADDLDKRILNRREWFRASTTRQQLEQCVEDLEQALPEDEFERCGLCDVKKMPTADKRYDRGYRWDCPECDL